MRSILIFIAVMSSVPAILFKAHVGVLVWAWVSYMNPHRLTFGMAYDFPFLDIIAIATAIALIFSPERKNLPNHPVLWLLVFFYLWTCVTTLFAVNPLDANEKWIKFSKIMLFTFLSIVLLGSKNRLHAFIWIICISIGFYGLKGGFFTATTGGVNIVWGPEGSFFGDNNHMALTLITTLPLLRYLSITAPHRYLRLIALFSILFFLAAIFGSQSRGAFLAAGTMLGFLVIRSNRRVLAMGLGAFAVIAAAVFMPPEWRERMEGIGDFADDPSARGRMDMWAYTFRVTDDSPVVGGGFLVHYSPQLRARHLPSGTTGRAVHSIYFEVLGEHGYVGFFLFILTAATAFFACGTIIRLSRDYPELSWAKELAPMLQTSLVGFGVGGAFLNLATFDLYYHILAIVVITYGIVARSLPAHVMKPQPIQIPKFNSGYAGSTAGE